MTDSMINIPDQCDVAIIGAGPSGLAAATELKKLGVASVMVLEREATAGGIPRHCGHSPFGMREFKRVLSGTQYTQRLSTTAEQAGVTLCLQTSVVSIAKGGELTLSTPNGVHTLNAKKVIICTGIRETPRSTRLVSGERPLGIVSTGALQSMVYLKHKKPFKQPIIIGTELVSFSAMFTALHAGARPVAMIEKNSRITARWGFQFLAALFRVPIYYQSKLEQILGKQRVEGIVIKQSNNEPKTINCDGVVFSGEFVAEASLLRMGHLNVDTTGKPVTDQFGRCSDPDYFATGNMTHPVETAGHCWSHGKKTAKHVFSSLQGHLDRYSKLIPLSLCGDNIKYITPQIIAVTNQADDNVQQHIQLRVNKAIKGKLLLTDKHKILAHKNINTLPERRITLTLTQMAQLTEVSQLEIRIKSD